MKKRFLLLTAALALVIFTVTALVSCSDKPLVTTDGAGAGITTSEPGITTLGSAQVTVAGPVFNLETEEIKTYDNDLLTGGDPFVMRYDGKYYLYCSTGNNSPIYVRVSDDLVNWSDNIICCTAQEVPAGTNEHGGVCNVALPAYAPEVTYFNGKFYMVTSLGGTGHHTFVADSPTGPFKLMTGNWGNTIDGHIFIDNDGKWYFYRANGGNILAYEMPTPLEPSKTAIQTGATIGNAWTEGPMVVYHDGMYYITYTGNHVSNPAYRIYYATSKQGCTKFSGSPENPLLVSTTSYVSGIGHSSSVKAPDLDSYYMIYHSKNYNNVRVVNIGRIVFNGSRMYVLGPTTEDAQTSLMPEIYAQFDNASDAALFDGTVSIKDGFMSVAKDSKILAKDSIDANKYTIEVTFADIAKGANAGVIFGYQDENNYGSAVFDTKNEQLIVTFVVNGEKTEEKVKLVRSFDMEYDFGAIQAIQVEKKGKNFTFYVNDRELHTAKSELSGGTKVGIITSGGTASVGYFGATGEVGGSSNDAHYKPVTSQTGYIQANHCLEEDIKTRSDSSTKALSIIAEEGRSFNYRILVERTGTHQLSVYLDPDEGAIIDVYYDGKLVGTIEPTAERSGYTEVLNGLEFEKGQHVITLHMKKGETKIQYLRITRVEEVRETTYGYAKQDVFEYKDGVCWKVENGGLTANGWGKRLYGKYNYSNYVISVDVTPKDFSKGGIGLLFRTQNPAETNLLEYMNAGRPITKTDENSAKNGATWMQGYFLEITQARLILNKDNYASKRITSENVTFEKNKTYNIKIECIDDTIRVYVDGEMKLEYIDDAPFLNGMVGYRMSGGSAVFDNFSIKKAED